MTASLWGGKLRRKIMQIIKNPSPTTGQAALNSARNSRKKSHKEHGSIEKRSLFTLFLRKARAGITVEAAMVLPLCLFFLVNLGNAVEMIRLHNNLQLALWDTGSKLALYGCQQGDSSVSSLFAAFYVRNSLLDYAGEEYLDRSPLVRGSGGLQLLESEMLNTGDMLDITLTYSVGPASPLAGFRPFRMANRFYAHLWNGYEISGTAEVEEIVYVAENGEVYHVDRNCTHLRLSVRPIGKAEADVARNQWGRRYGACEKCVRGEPPEIWYVTDEGDCYHYLRNCPGLKRTVFSLTMEEASGYRPCSRCAGR